jgi:hypothetical protein
MSRVRVSGLVSNSPVGAPGPPCRWRYSYQIGRVEVLVPSGYRRPAAVGVTELCGVAGAAKGRRTSSGNGAGPPRGPLEDWSGLVVGLTSESRVQVALIMIRVAARPVRNIPALDSAGCSAGNPHWTVRVALRATRTGQCGLPVRVAQRVALGNPHWTVRVALRGGCPPVIRIQPERPSKG